MTELGLFDSVKRLGATLTAIAATRLALLANELHEERLRLTQMLLFTMLALFCFGLTVVFLTTFLVVLFWDSHRLMVLGGLCIVFFSLGSAMLFLLRQKVSQKPTLFAASLAELSKDQASLQ
ncbi:MAG: phage holin family protein [Gallionella sp.]|nr:phage holin family protein [Gallionella sp.]